MGVRQNYKATNAGIIPEDWNDCRLGDGITLISGHHVLAKHCNTQGKGVPYLTGPADFPDGKISHSKFCERPLTICKKKDILITVKGSGSGLLTISDNTYCISRQLMAIRVYAWDSKFVFYNLAYISDQLIASSTGLIPGLSRNDIVNRRIPIPYITEQRAIAETLGDLDSLLNALERLIAKKRDIKQAAMQQLLTGKKRLPQFSGNWIKKRFSELAIPRKKKISSSEYQSRTTCIELENMVSEAGVLHKRPSFENYNSQKTVFKKGDILFGRLRAYLKKYWLADCDGVCSTEIWALCPDSAQITSEFLFQLIQTEQFIAAASITYGTHMPRSDWDIVKNIDFLIPTREEQNALSSMLADMDSEIIVLEARIQKTRALKQAMMQELLTGKTRLVKPEARHAGKTAS